MRKLNRKIEVPLTESLDAEIARVAAETGESKAGWIRRQVVELLMRRREVERTQFDPTT